MSLQAVLKLGWTFDQFYDLSGLKVQTSKAADPELRHNQGTQPPSSLSQEVLFSRLPVGGVKAQWLFVVVLMRSDPSATMQPPTDNDYTSSSGERGAQ